MRKTTYVLDADVRGSCDGVAYEYAAGTHTPKGAVEVRRFERFVRFGFARIEKEKKS